MISNSPFSDAFAAVPRRIESRSSRSGGRRSADDTIRLTSVVTIEENHPDFAFLPGLVRHSSTNDGLMLPSAGSDMLRETIRVLSNQADQLVHAANIAMQQGNKAGAKAVVKKALEADPNNAEAQAIDRIMGNRLITQK